MKKQILKKVALTLAITSVMATVGVTPTYAANTSSGVARKTINIKCYENHVSAYNKFYTTRSKKYNNVQAKLYNVWPVTNREDDFTKIRVKIFRNDNGSYSAISKEVTLTEGNASWTTISLTGGNGDINHPYFGFIGNSPNHSAKADVGYDPR